MDLPRLDPDNYGNEHLHALLRRVHPDDVRPFVEKLTKQPLRDRFHTYRELLIGVHLRDRGFDARYEQAIFGQTPDWSLIDSGGNFMELIDVLTLHQRHDKDVEISAAIRAERLWAGWITVPPDHIFRKLNDKAGQYSGLARQIGIPYVLAAYGEFTAAIDPQEIEQVLLFQHGGWFATRPEVSGFIYCRETQLEFEYTYFANPHASHGSTLFLGEIPG
jgi:hypothetical protein